MTEGHPPPAEETAATTPPVPGARPVLRRSRGDRVIAGVAGGLGRYFGIDPVLLRIAFVVLVFLGGSGLLLYLVGWLAIPEEREGEELGPAPERFERFGGAELVGIGLIVLGGLFLLRLVLPDVFEWRYVWPVVLILLGLLVLLRGARR